MCRRSVFKEHFSCICTEIVVVFIRISEFSVTVFAVRVVSVRKFHSPWMLQRNRYPTVAVNGKLFRSCMEKLYNGSIRCHCFSPYCDHKCPSMVSLPAKRGIIILGSVCVGIWELNNFSRHVTSRGFGHKMSALIMNTSP